MKLNYLSTKSAPLQTQQYDPSLRSGQAADGARVRKTEGPTTTLYLGAAVEVQIRGATRVTTTYYFFGSQRVAMRVTTGTITGTVTWLHGDHLGSASLATNVSGAKVAGSDARYTPFGEYRAGLAGAGNASDNRFTGQKRLATGWGLDDFNARFYAAALARFVSADTLVPGPGDPQALNRYAYARDNPLKYSDPSGHVFVLALVATPIVAVGALAMLGVAAVYYSNPRNAVQAERAAMSLAADAQGFIEGVFTNPGQPAMTNSGGMPLAPSGMPVAESVPLPASVGEVEYYPEVPAPIGPLLESVPAHLGSSAGVIRMTAKAWQVGEYGELESRNDDLELHHVPQRHPAYQVIPGYDEWTGPAIAVPKDVHRKFLNPRNVTGTYGGTAKELVEKGLRDLRAAGAPARAVERLERLIYRRYKEHLQK